MQAKSELRDINGNLDKSLGERPLAEWEKLIQLDEFANRAREDVENVLKSIHAARKKPKEHLFAFGIGMHSATWANEP